MTIQERRTTQVVAPAEQPPPEPGYRLYPAYPLEDGLIRRGFAALAQHLASARTAVLDGYGGVLWEDFRDRLNAALQAQGRAASWVCVDEALRPEAEIDALVSPFLGGDDPLFGTRFTGGLHDFFDPAKLARLVPDEAAELTLLYGCGAALANWTGPLLYVELPKNEIQFRARAGRVHNLGMSSQQDARAVYKRCYFVDWAALNAHKATLLERIDVMIDHQRPSDPCLMTGDDLRAGLDAMSRTCFRARPWFEPGPWGGQWLKEHLPQLPQEPPNYAWSFELITPENGLVFASGGLLLEVSFDCLMFRAHQAVLGHAAERFGTAFPIRFDFLDTVRGGNLSLQCHPGPAYARRHFGEPFTQDETYYILDSEPGASVYLGFQADLDPAAFRQALDDSQRQHLPVEVERYVQRHPATRHDLFLIPHGAVHCSGAGSLILEISATPYIFTFKLYDWLRLDLEGRPRPLNIERAFENLRFELRGERVARELISRPQLRASGPDWRVFQLPTHPDHFYDIERLEFTGTFQTQTGGNCHIMSLVEGQSVILETQFGMRQRFAFAETFVVPAAAGSYRLINEGQLEAKVIRAYVRPTGDAP